MTNSSSSADAESDAPKKTATNKTRRPAPAKNTGSDSETRAPRRPKRLRPAEAIREAREQLAELTGKPVDAVSTFNATEDGWRLEVEVLELERVPDTMSLLASYEVTLDREGMLTGYQRLRRYERGRSDDRRSG
ncbi:gas vesicle protein [Streptomyces sp. NPDC046716]|uniref:gas vesicle protein GvpO n=1 Tax=Streptomyces sp. NPDC046716 TaxID=3157093 RepID=UPI0033C70FA3